MAQEYCINKVTNKLKRDHVKKFSTALELTFSFELKFEVRCHFERSRESAEGIGSILLNILIFQTEDNKSASHFWFYPS